MRRFFIKLFVLFVLMSPALIQAQTSKTFPENLQKLTSQAMMGMDQTQLEGLPVYDLDGNLLSDEKAKEQMQGMGFIPEYYADSSGKVVAIRLRKITEQEEAMIKQFYEQQAKLAALVGTPAKTFETVDMEGNPVDLEQMKGSVVAINFWFIGCKPCIKEMPELNEIVEHYKDENVKFIAIALDRKQSLVKFSEKRDFDYDIVPDGRPLANLYEIMGYPTHCIIDQEGNIAYFKSAYSPMTATELRQTIDGLLKK